jgi:hypothetical protein
MRAAKVFGCVDVPEVDPAYLENIKRDATKLDGFVERLILKPEARRSLEALCPDAFDYGLYATLWVDPHTDDEISGDVTLGIVIAGDHYLFTGNVRRVGDLVPGTVFALLNKKQHGAFPIDRNNPSPLVFAACEPNVAAEDWRSFCLSIEKAFKL